MKTTLVDIEDITLDTRLQFRLGKGPYGTDQETMERYAEDMRRGVEFPPIICVELTTTTDEYEHGTLVCVSGMHRVCAARLAGLKELRAEIVQGTWQDARCLAFRQNSDHGRPRTSAEVRAALDAAAKDYPGLTVRKYAEMVDCSPSAVQRWKDAKSGDSKTAPPPKQQPGGTSAKTEEVVPVESDDVHEDDIVPSANVDPFNDIRLARREADTIVAELLKIKKRVAEIKETRGGARIKFGVFEKAIEEARRHIDQYSPSVIVPSEVIEEIGKDITDGQGWLHKMGLDRVDQQLLAKCEKL